MKLSLTTLAAALAVAGAAAAQTPAPAAASAPPTTAAAPATGHEGHAMPATAAAAATPAAPQIAATPEAQALAALIAGLQAGNIDYAKLDERIGGAMKPQQAGLINLIKSKGALVSIEAKGAGANGVQNLSARFEKDSTDFGVGLDAQGRIAGFTVTD